MVVQIQLRRDTAANWTSVDPTLAEGEMGIETDTDKFKFGDGATAWTGLAYGGSTGLADQGDFTYIDGTVASAPGTPSAGFLRLYAKTGDVLAVKNDAGVETVLGQGIADQGAFTFLDATGASAPSTPASGFARIYAKTDGRIYSKDDAGVEYGPFDASGGGGGGSGFVAYVLGLSNLTHYWPLNEAFGATTFVDNVGSLDLDSSNANELAPGGPPLDRDWTAGGSVIFGTRAELITTGGVTWGSAFSYGMWVFIPDAITMGLIGQWNGSGSMAYIADATHVRAYSGGSYAEWTAGSLQDVIGLHLVGVTHDGTDIALWWDGTQVATSTQTIPSGTSGGNFEVAGYNAGSSVGAMLGSDAMFFDTNLDSTAWGNLFAQRAVG